MLLTLFLCFHIFHPLEALATPEEKIAMTSIKHVKLNEEFTLKNGESAQLPDETVVKYTGSTHRHLDGGSRGYNTMEIKKKDKKSDVIYEKFITENVETNGKILSEFIVGKYEFLLLGAVYDKSIRLMIKGESTPASVQDSVTSRTGQAISLFKMKNYEKALDLLTAVINEEPKNASAWLYLGRTIVAMNAGKDPQDYCKFENNPIFLALASLNKAIEVSPAPILSALESSDEVHFQKFMNTEEYKKWLIASKPLPANQDSLSEFLLKNKNWMIPGDSPRYVTFQENSKFLIEQLTPKATMQTEKWNVQSDNVEIFEKPNRRIFKLYVQDFYFAEGMKYFKTLVLKETGGKNEEWTFGVQTSDCN